MKTAVRKAGKVGTVCGATIGSALLAVSTAMTASGESTALVINGMGVPTTPDLIMSQMLGGAFRDEKRVSVYWPAQARPYTGANDLTLGESIRQGKTNLGAEIEAALARLDRDENGNVINGDQVTVVGLSGGALVVTEVLRDMATDVEAPDDDDINFVVIADSSRQKLVNESRYNPVYDYTYQPAPDTKYDTITVTGEYDGLADFPDRWWNLTAVQNALAGALTVHVSTAFADLTKVPTENITTDINSVGGSTTHYLVPTAKLPLVALNPSLASREAELKRIVDAGYSRNDDRPSLLSAPAAAPASSSKNTATSVADEPNQPGGTDDTAPAVLDAAVSIEASDGEPTGDDTDAIDAAETADAAPADATATTDATDATATTATTDRQTQAAEDTDATTSKADAAGSEESADADQDADSAGSDASSESASEDSASSASDSSE